MVNISVICQRKILEGIRRQSGAGDDEKSGSWVGGERKQKKVPFSSVFIFITFRFGVVSLSGGEGALMNSVEKSSFCVVLVGQAIEDGDRQTILLFTLILYLYITIFYGNCFCHPPPFYHHYPCRD